MTTQKFEKEIDTLKVFLQTYCLNKHNNQSIIEKNITYKELQFNLCNDCLKVFEYSFEKLQNCPHEEKVKCRQCPNPCYDKYHWKQLAKIMRYSGMKLGLLRLKNKLFS